MIFKPENIDFSRYKRFFAFGCSFTNWRWPSWYDIIKTQLHESVECYNTGRAGAGNLYIASQYSMYNQKYKFNDTDLVMIMWSTFMREDRYLDNKWSTPGNIFTQSFYPESYVKQYADTRGYLIRDLGLIDLVTNSLDLSPAESIPLLSVSADYQSDQTISDVIELYRTLLARYPKSFCDFLGEWGYGHQYYDPHYDKTDCKTVDEPHKPNFKDYHPTTEKHWMYLSHLNFNLSDDAKKYSYDTVKKYNEYTHISQFRQEKLMELV